MIDFTSSLYLGMEHPSSALGPWARLTTGRPAALGAPTGTRDVERALAGLQGCERTTLAPSTLHLAWDLFGILAEEPGVSIHVDRGAYPIVLWGVERAAARGVPVRTFAHHDPADLARSLARVEPRSGRPLIVADGSCPSCGGIAPLGDYYRAGRARGGLLVVDDTQGLGIFGEPASGTPYGRGGGGTVRRLGISGDHVVLISSLAKGFGVPLAALSGTGAMVGAFVRESSTRVHTSPPSVVTLRAAARALRLNELRGDALRSRLAANVLRLRTPLLSAGLVLEGGMFPVQSLSPVRGFDPVAMHSALEAAGIRTFLTQSRCDGAPRLGFVIRADHEPDHIDRAAQAVLNVKTSSRTRRTPRSGSKGILPCGERETDTRCTFPTRASERSSRGRARPEARRCGPTRTPAAPVA